MWKTRLAWGLGILGAIAGAVAPILNEAEQTAASGSDGASISLIDGVVGGGIWALIGFGVGSLIDRSRRNRPKVDM